MGRTIINTASALHSGILQYWRREEENHFKKCASIQTRFERAAEEVVHKGECQGDKKTAKVRDIFHNGLGIKWGEDQVRVFNASLFSSLPLIYGNEWSEHKARVLDEWGEKRECPYTVVSMARRNGKTFVTSGFVISMFLALGIKIAIFSTCKRTSQMMMSAAVDMLEQAFELGTHCNRQDFVQVSKNTESIIYEGPDRTKRILGCFPGSVRVSSVFFGGEQSLRERERESFPPPPGGGGRKTNTPQFSEKR
jgi:hypothetical protein